MQYRKTVVAKTLLITVQEEEL